MLIQSFAGEFRRYRSLAERALNQVEDAHLHRKLDSSGNSIAILIQHLGGNLASRFHDLLHTDGETSWRNRDREFDDRGQAKEPLMEIWGRGWGCLEACLANLHDQDLSRHVTIRRVPLTVAEALARSLSHVAYHVGQIVQLAQALCGSAWRGLSVPKGGSAAYLLAPDLEKPPGTQRP